MSTTNKKYFFQHKTASKIKNIKIKNIKKNFKKKYQT
jgi:hypothetical protein